MSMSFAEVWPDSGVDDASKKYPVAMMVPATGANLVMLKGAAGQLRFKPDSHFTVKEITATDKAAIRTAKREVPELALRSKSEDAASLFELIPFVGEAMAKEAADQMPARKLDDAFARAKAASARLLLVEGARRGEGSLTVKSDNGEASIKVVVRDKKTVSVSFHFVEDIGPDGRPRKRSKWTPADASRWIARLNDIYTPQTNISFTLQANAPLPVKASLPDQVSLQQWQGLQIKPPGRAAANVFLVGKWLGDKNDPLGSFIIASKDIVLDDLSTHDEFITTLAHEMGHFLGASVNFKHPEPGDKSFLMTTLAWRQGAHIPQGYAQHFNPI